MILLIHYSRTNAYFCFFKIRLRWLGNIFSLSFSCVHNKLSILSKFFFWMGKEGVYFSKGMAPDHFKKMPSYPLVCLIFCSLVSFICRYLSIFSHRTLPLPIPIFRFLFVLKLYASFFEKTK